MSTFDFAIEGDENFSACGAIYIASWLRRARTIEIARCYSSLQNLIAVMVTIGAISCTERGLVRMH